MKLIGAMLYTKFIIIVILVICSSLSSIICSHTNYSGSQLADWDDESSENSATSYIVEAVLGRTVHLPCDIESNVRDDRVYMVLWFKYKASKPFYSFDVRGRSLSKALCWSEPSIFGPRAYFVTVSKPARLQIDNTQLDDEALYRCRVDFQNSPTRNTQIKLTVIVPPSQLILYDISGRELVDTVGPMTEGSNIVLICEVRGGKPLPTVHWFINERLVDGRVDTHDHRVTVNKLELLRIQRSQLNSTFKCQASNTNLVLPVQKTVRLELILRPLTVKLRWKPTSLIMGEEYAIICESKGSKPQALLSWWKDDMLLENTEITTTSNQTITTSLIRLHPTPNDNGLILKCRGENIEIPGSAIEDFVPLNVLYAPLVSLQLGNNLNAVHIKEGDDIYFECKIESNPREHKITWLKNKSLITQDMAAGIIISTRSLVLQKISRNQTGNYSCAAANDRGESFSEPVPLRVQFSPVCVTNEVLIVGGAVDETLRIHCHVAADPTSLNISWQFSSSEKSHTLMSNDFHFLNDTVSELTYKIKSEKDYGTLTCWADNAIGRQIDPCIFQIVPATRPEPLKNCSVKSSLGPSNEVMIVECVAGYDGGLPQSFHLEALESASHHLRVNLSRNHSPIFSIEASSFREREGHNTLSHLLLYSANQKGRSEYVIIEDISLNGAQKRPEWKTNQDLIEWNSNLTIFLVVTTCLLIGGSILFTVFMTAKKSNGKHNVLIPATENLKLPVSSSANLYTMAFQLKTSFKQPDIISGGNSDHINSSLAESKKYFNKCSKTACMHIHYTCNATRFLCQDSGTNHSAIKCEPVQKIEARNSLIVCHQKPIINQILGPESCV